MRRRKPATTWVCCCAGPDRVSPALAPASRCRKKVLNYIWDNNWDPWEPTGGHDNNQYAGVDR